MPFLLTDVVDEFTDYMKTTDATPIIIITVVLTVVSLIVATLRGKSKGNGEASEEEQQDVSREDTESNQ